MIILLIQSDKSDLSIKVTFIHHQFIMLYVYADACFAICYFLSPLCDMLYSLHQDLYLPCYLLYSFIIFYISFAMLDVCTASL